MSVIVEPSAPVPAVADPSTAAQRAARRWRRWRWAAAVAGVVLVIAVVAALLVPRTMGKGRLDPDSASEEGSRAVAQILRRQRVDVVRVRLSASTQEARRGDTLVVVDTNLLTPDVLGRLAASPADLVLVEPDAVTLQALAPSVVPAGVKNAHVTGPDCRLPAAVAAGAARAGGSVYQAKIGASCYPESSGAASYVQVTQNGRQVVVVGQGELLMNAYLAEDGNAALALWTLGRNSRLVWYVPDPAELSASTQESLPDLVPPATGWVAAQLVLTALVFMLWRGRRLGRLVTEPLPVVVRAAETQEGRARLYRKARARGRAAATLRTAALRRLARRLDVGAQVTPEQVAALAAATSHLPPAQVGAVLLGGPPENDAALVRLASDLDAVEAAVSGPQQYRATRDRSAGGRNPAP